MNLPLQNLWHYFVGIHYHYMTRSKLQKFFIWSEEKKDEQNENKQEIIIKSGNNSDSAQNGIEFLKWKYKKMKRFIEKLVEELRVDLLIMSRGLQDFARGKAIDTRLADVIYRNELTIWKTHILMKIQNCGVNLE